jgi:hypothetical protein
MVFKFFLNLGIQKQSNQITNQTSMNESEHELCYFFPNEYFLMKVSRIRVIPRKPILV